MNTLYHGDNLEGLTRRILRSDQDVREFQHGTWLIARTVAILLPAPVPLSAGPSSIIEGGEQTFRGDDHVISIDDLRGLITAKHGLSSGLSSETRTESPVQPGDLVRLFCLGERIACTVVLLEGSHGVPSIAALQVQSSEWSGPLLATWGPDVLSVGDLAFLLAGLILLVWWQGRHLRSVIARARADIVRTIQTQHAAQQSIVMSLKAIAEALAGFHSDIRRLGTRIGAARHGSPTADTRPGRSDPLPLVVVRRDETEIFRVLQVRLDKPDLARVIWDRRVAERRQRNERASERRQGERRGREPVTWTGLGYLVIEPRAVDT